MKRISRTVVGMILLLLASVAPAAAAIGDYQGTYEFNFSYTTQTGVKLGLAGTMDIQVAGTSGTVTITGSCTSDDQVVYPIDCSSALTFSSTGDEAYFTVTVQSHEQTVLRVELKITTLTISTDIKKALLLLKYSSDGSGSGGMSSFQDLSIAGSWQYQFSITGLSHQCAGDGTISVDKNGTSGSVTVDGTISCDGHQLPEFSINRAVSIKGMSLDVSVTINEGGAITFSRDMGMFMTSSRDAALHFLDLVSGETETSSVSRTTATTPTPTPGSGGGGGGGGCDLGLFGPAALILLTPLLLARKTF